MAELLEETLEESPEKSLEEEKQGEPSEPEKAPETKEEPAAPPKPPKERGRLLLPLLTILLVVLGIGEAVFWVMMGLSTYQTGRARQLYEEQQAAIEAERQAQGITGGSAYGPGFKVENGVVTWRWEDELSASGSGGTGLTQDAPGETRMSVLSVPKINYALADQSETETISEP